LNLALFVAAEHDRMLGRIQVQPHHVIEPGGERRIMGQLERRDPVRLEAMRPPDPQHRRAADADPSGHQVAAPVRGLLRLLLRGQFDDLLRDRVASMRRSAATGPVLEQPRHARLQKPSAPLGDALAAATEVLGDLQVLQAFRGTQHDAGPLRDSDLGGGNACQRLQLLSLGVGQRHLRGPSHGHAPLGAGSSIGKGR
jgi:hypothetical protein